MNDIQRMCPKDRFAVIVVSCDRYSDLWGPFFNLFFRFWPDRSLNTYLLSNNRQVEIPGIVNLQIGEDVSWSDNLKKAIGLLREDYVLLFMDDLFLIDYVKNEKIMKTCDWMAHNNANYVRLNPSVPPDRPYNALLGVVSIGTIYRTSTVLSVWRKEVLLRLLAPGESAWEFEIFGSERSDSYDGFYSTWEDLLPVINSVIKGKWLPNALRKLNTLEVPLDMGRREVMSTRESMVFGLKRLRTSLLHFLPAQYRRKVKDAMLSGKYRY